MAPTSDPLRQVSYQIINQIALKPSILVNIELDVLDSSACSGQPNSFTHRISHTDYNGNPFQNSKILRTALSKDRMRPCQAPKDPVELQLLVTECPRENKIEMSWGYNRL